MGAKKKKIKSAGKFSSSGGVNVRKSYNAIEFIQRKRQKSPFHPRGRAIRIAAGIWKCLKTGRKFASDAYHLENK